MFISSPLSLHVNISLPHCLVYLSLLGYEGQLMEKGKDIGPVCACVYVCVTQTAAVGCECN